MLLRTPSTLIKCPWGETVKFVCCEYPAVCSLGQRRDVQVRGQEKAITEQSGKPRRLSGRCCNMMCELGETGQRSQWGMMQPLTDPGEHEKYAQTRMDEKAAGLVTESTLQNFYPPGSSRKAPNARVQACYSQSVNPRPSEAPQAPIRTCTGQQEDEPPATGTRRAAGVGWAGPGGGGKGGSGPVREDLRRPKTAAGRAFAFYRRGQPGGKLPPQRLRHPRYPGWPELPTNRASTSRTSMTPYAELSRGSGGINEGLLAQNASCIHSPQKAA